MCNIRDWELVKVRMNCRRWTEYCTQGGTLRSRESAWAKREQQEGLREMAEVRLSLLGDVDDKGSDGACK